MAKISDNFYLLPSNSLVNIKLNKNNISIDNEKLKLEAATSVLTSKKSLKLKGYTKNDSKIEPFEYHLSHGQPNIIKNWHRNLQNLRCKKVSKLNFNILKIYKIQILKIKDEEC